MLKSARLLILPLFLLAATGASAQTSINALLNQTPEKIAALRADPHIAKAVKFLEVSNSRADVLKKADGVVDAVIMSEQRDHPGQNALFWNAFRSRVQAEIQGEASDFLFLSAQLYAERFTDAELDQLISFYSTGIGAKYFRERGRLDRQEIDLASAWSEQLAPKVMERVRGKLSAVKANEQ